MSKQKNKMFLVLYGGERIEVIGDKGKYYLCEGRQFRKESGQIAAVEFASVEDEKVPAKKKKPVQKKKEG